LSFSDGVSDQQVADVKQKGGSMFFPNGEVKITVRLFNALDDNIGTALMYLTFKIANNDVDF
jgi:hypothetical protein